MNYLHYISIMFGLELRKSKFFYLVYNTYMNMKF